MDANNEFSSKSIDEMFSSLSSDIAGINRLVSDLNERKTQAVDDVRKIAAEREVIERQKSDVDLYIAKAEAEILKKKNDIDIYLENRQRALTNAENEFRKKMETSLKELEIMRQEFMLEKDKIKEEKDQFEAYKNIEIEKIQYAARVLTADKEQFEKYRQVAMERVNLETRNLENRCSKFKDIVNQFNTNFKPSIDMKEE